MSKGEFVPETELAALDWYNIAEYDLVLWSQHVSLE